MVLPNTTLAKIVVYREIGYSWDKIASKLGLKGRSTPRMAYNRYIIYVWSQENLQDDLGKLLKEEKDILCGG